MARPRTDIDRHVERLLLDGETELSYLRRTAIMAALREQFPGVRRSTLVSAIVRVLRKRRKSAQEFARMRGDAQETSPTGGICKEIVMEKKRLAAACKKVNRRIGGSYNITRTNGVYELWTGNAGIAADLDTDIYAAAARFEELMLEWHGIEVVV